MVAMVRLLTLGTVWKSQALVAGGGDRVDCFSEAGVGQRIPYLRQLEESVGAEAFGRLSVRTRLGNFETAGRRMERA